MQREHERAGKGQGHSHSIRKKVFYYDVRESETKRKKKQNFQEGSSKVEKSRRSALSFFCSGLDVKTCHVYTEAFA